VSSVESNSSANINIFMQHCKPCQTASRGTCTVDGNHCRKFFKADCLAYFNPCPQVTAIAIENHCGSTQRQSQGYEFNLVSEYKIALYCNVVDTFSTRH